MPVAVLDQVQPIIGEFSERLRSCLDRAMSDWLADPNRARFRWARTRANVLFEHVIRHALAEFDGDGNNAVKAILEAQSIKFLFRNSVVARFKKGNARGVGSNIETQAFLDFVEPQGTFQGIPEIHRVEIVYQLNLLGTDFAEVAVVARDKQSRIWSYPLTSRPTAEIVPISLPSQPDVRPPTLTPRRAGARKPAGDASK